MKTNIMGEVVAGQATNQESQYSHDEIDKIVEQNKEEILSFCKEQELLYAERGRYGRNESMIVYFDVTNNNLFLHVIGQGIDGNAYIGIKQGNIIIVHKFKSGVLYDAAQEGLNYSLEDDGEAEKFHKQYTSEEIDEDEYWEKYDEIIQPWIDEYYKDYLEATVEIDIEYPGEDYGRGW